MYSACMYFYLRILPLFFAPDPDFFFENSFEKQPLSSSIGVQKNDDTSGWVTQA